jgi:hypothetical protein
MDLSRLTRLAGAPAVREALSGDAERLEAAVNEAELAFWDVIAKAYPEIKTGDLDPGAAHRLTTAMTAAVEAWLDANEA